MLLMLLFLGFSDKTADLDLIRKNYQTHVYFLASDHMRGRETTEPGQKIAADYIALHLSRHGLTPGLPENPKPWFQEFELLVTETDKQASSLTLRGRGESPNMAMGKDYIAFAYQSGNYSGSGPLVFAGYGLQMEGYNDFEGLDVANRWVVLMSGRPHGNGPIFSKEELEGTRNFQKIMNLWEKNALGVIMLGDSSPMKGWDSPSMQLANSDEPGSSDRSFPMIWVMDDQWEELLGKYHKRVQKSLKQIAEKEKPAGFNLKGRSMTFNLKYRKNYAVSENVVGIIPGSDPELADEYVVFSAHYDHVGTRGDEVYNGADDNASGTTTLMLLAERLIKMKPRRSAMFLFASAEEHGLLGSQHFVDNPTVPLEQIVGNMNFDMVGRNKEGAIGYIPAKNEDTTTISDVLKGLNKDNGHNIKLLTDMDRFHRRSDHYNFVEKGIPAIFFIGGLHEDYHKPTDDPHLLEYDHMARHYFLYEDLALALLNNDERPRFHKDMKEKADDKGQSEDEAVTGDGSVSSTPPDHQ